VTGERDKRWLEAHLPHHGRMNLLDRVGWWDADAIRCSARSHRDADNPLRRGGELPIAAAIEYAAQAAAAHGALLMGESGPPGAGVLASARSVSFGARRLDDIAGPLEMHVQRIGGDEAGVIYGFRVDGDGRELASGRLAVFFAAAGGSAPA
jgi:predicted hotdog family 3-hydroxylacyl-ACP dehydratase